MNKSIKEKGKSFLKENLIEVSYEEHEDDIKKKSFKLEVTNGTVIDAVLATIVATTTLTYVVNPLLSFLF